MTLSAFWNWIKETRELSVNGDSPTLEGIFSPENCVIRARLEYKDGAIGLIATINPNLQTKCRFVRLGSPDKLECHREHIRAILEKHGVSSVV